MDYQRTLVFPNVVHYPHVAGFIQKISEMHNVSIKCVICEYFSDSLFLTSSAQKLKLFLVRCMELVDDPEVKRSAIRGWNRDLQTITNPWTDGSFVDVLFHPCDDVIQDTGRWCSLEKKCECLRSCLESACFSLSLAVKAFPRNVASDLMDVKLWRKIARHAPSKHRLITGAGGS
jgi:hypothetical protein